MQRVQQAKEIAEKDRADRFLRSRLVIGGALNEKFNRAATTGSDLFERCHRLKACSTMRGARGGTDFSLCSGQALVEFALAWGTIILPLTFAIIFTSELLWIWHSVADFTRDGARYAATHCWQGDGSNVITYMKANIPLMPDQAQFQNGPAQIEVSYFSRDPDSGELLPFSCAGDCSTTCIPDVVTVAVTNYQFSSFVTTLGIPPIPIPDFHTSVPVESAGCDPEQGVCLP